MERDCEVTIGKDRDGVGEVERGIEKESWKIEKTEAQRESGEMRGSKPRQIVESGRRGREKEREEDERRRKMDAEKSVERQKE